MNAQLPRLTVVQYGDYAEAFRRFEEGGAETYYAQRYTVDFLGELLREGAVGALSVVTAMRDAPDAIMSNGIRTEGVQLWSNSGVQNNKIFEAITRTEPSHLIIAIPHVPLLRFALRSKAAVLPLFADSFHARGLRDRVRFWRLARCLNDDRFSFVANHNLAATLDLSRIGVKPKKLLPFDWPALITPKGQTAKSAPSDGLKELVYVGQVTAEKGVGDAIKALAHMRAQGKSMSLKIIGTGDVDGMRAHAASHRVEDAVVFEGPQSHDVVLEAMRKADVVLVPSRHTYPEGLPMTLYEAMCMRTPLVVSDHPMFRLRIRDGVNAVVFEAASPLALAEALKRLADDDTLYEGISRGYEKTAEDYLSPLKWHELVKAFLSPEPAAVLTPFTLAEAM